MSAINNGTFTFSPEELKDWSKVIHELVYENEDLRRIHDVESGIKYDQQIVFAGRMGLMGKAVRGCTPNEISGITLTDKFWRPVREDFRLPHCNANVNEQDKLVQQFSKMNPDFYNIFEGSGSSVGAFLVERVVNGFNENLLRKIWFSDTLAEQIGNGGNLTNGTDKEYFNTFDGLFKQLFTDITTPDKNYVNIAKNAGASYVAQELASGDALAILRAMYKGADSRLKALNDAKIYVTQTLWDAYLDDLENIQNSGAGNTMLTENGQMRLTFRGIEVVAMEVWDRNIDSFYNNGTVWDKPHRAVYTTPMNIPVATLAESDFGDVDAFYDKVTKKNYIDGVYTIDAKHLEKYLTVVAY